MNAKEGLTLIAKDGKTKDQILGDTVVCPTFHNGVLIHTFEKGSFAGEALNINAVIESLSNSTQKVKNGDLSLLEDTLIGQAQALQALFTTFAQRAETQKTTKGFEILMGMSFKAQAQCRATLQTLIELKFPRQATFVKQANISHGHQQVNNGVESHARETNASQNKLFEGDHHGGEKMDFRATQSPSPSNSTLATMETVHGR